MPKDLFMNLIPMIWWCCESSEVSEGYNAIHQLKSNKSPDPYEVPAELIK